MIRIILLIKLVYSYIESNKTINNMDIGLIENNNLFTLSFVSSSDKYNKYLPTIEKMIETFETDTSMVILIEILKS